MILDDQGKLLGRQDFTPFWLPLNVKAPASPEFRMAGERYIREAGFYLLNGRLYDPEVGRFHTWSPLSGDLHRYDSFNVYARACRRAGVFMQPRCNQTSRWNQLYLLPPDLV